MSIISTVGSGEAKAASEPSYSPGKKGRKEQFVKADQRNFSKLSTFKKLEMKKRIYVFYTNNVSLDR